MAFPWDQQLHYLNHAGLLVRRGGLLRYRCPACGAEGGTREVLKKCPKCKGKGKKVDGGRQRKRR